jgi:hypothetical protein
LKQLRLSEEQLAEIQRRLTTGGAVVREHRIKDEAAPWRALPSLVTDADRERAKNRKWARPPVERARVMKASEKRVLDACLKLLSRHPKVAFAWRQNTGMAVAANRVVRFSFRGCSDIVGMLHGGRFLAVECKATGKKATEEQDAFLQVVRDNGGLSLCVDDPQILINALEAAR